MMQYTILDLEWNGTYSHKRKGYFNEIIQFGAVRLDETLCRIGEFSTFVQPVEGKKLTGLVRKLTNITNDDLLTGVSFLEALEAFRKFSEGSVLLTWGTCDMRELTDNYQFHTGITELPLKNLYGNLQDYCQMAIGMSMSQQIGLSNAAEKLDVSSSQMALHRAIDDSILSAACFARVYDPAKLQKMLEPVDKKFCERLVYRAHYLNDLNDPLVDRNKLRFRCPECSAKLRICGEWESHNKHFTSKQECPQCGKKYLARVQFKKRYDDVQIRRKLMEDVPKEEKSGSEGADSEHGN